MTLPNDDITTGQTISLTPVLGASPYTFAAGLQITPINQIGVGEGRHIVFLGRDHQLDADFVYKRIPKASMPSPAEFFAEARRLHESRHRHVVPVNYACETTDFVFVAMPHFSKGSLQSEMEKRMLTVREVVKLGLDFLMGLHHAHIRKVIHFDVKPNNIFLDNSDAAMLADFGQSRIADMDGFAATPRMYPMHVPPEADTSSHLTRSADIYQAGLTLYRMCVGEHAWRRQTAVYGDSLTSKFKDDLLRGRFPARAAFPEHIPTRLQNIIRRALKTKPEDRWNSVVDLMSALASLENGPLDWQAEETADGGMAWSFSPDSSEVRISLEHDGSGKWSVEKNRVRPTQMRYRKDCLGQSSEPVARQHVRALLKVS